MRAPRTDKNQPEIVKALREAGCTVAITAGVHKGFPDLVVGQGGRNVLMEVKAPRGVLTPDQQEFFRAWQGRCVVVRSVEEALMAMGVEDYAGLVPKGEI